MTDAAMAQVMDRVRPAPSGCWIWLGGLSTTGYGRMTFNKRQEQVHRLTYTAYRGPIPEGLELDHLCRVRRCVNPDHLEAVTHRVNVLRGTSTAAQQARKTHCKRGHEFTPENTRVPASGGRMCRTCVRESALAPFDASKHSHGSTGYQRGCRCGLCRQARTGATPRSAPKCGTVSGYNAHRRKGETACADCLRAKADYSKAWDHARKAAVA